MVVKKRKVKRVVLGVGHPWFSSRPGEADYTDIALTKRPVAASLVLRNFEWVGLEYANVGNWNKARLVLEILE